MERQQVEAQVGVARVGFGSAGMKRLAVRGDHGRVHGIEVEALIFNQEVQQTPGLLFQRHGQLAAWMLSMQIREPGVQDRGIMGEGLRGALLRGRIQDTDIMMVIGPVNADG